MVRRLTGSADALKNLLLDLKKYSFSGYVRTIRVVEGQPSEGIVLVQGGNPIASFHFLGDKQEASRSSLKQVWQDSYDPTCSIELHARVDVDDLNKRNPAGSLERAKKLVRKTKPAAPSRADLEATVGAWREQGLEVRDLETAVKGDEATARAAIAAFEENVKKIRVLQEILAGLDTTGFEPQVAAIQEKLRDPRKHVAAEADVEELREAIERSRAEREARVVENEKEREVQQRAREVFELILKHRQEAGKATEGLTEAAIARAMEEKPTARDERTNLIRPFTFDTFVVGPSNRFAHAAALAVSKSPHSAYNPLLITSGPGLGKTHLLNAIGSYIGTVNGSARILFCSVEAFTNEFREAQGGGKMAEFREKYRGLDVFLLDDVQFLSGRGDVQEELFHTFNELYNAGKQIALTSDRPPKEIPDLEDRLVSRFESGLIADIQPPEYETRVAILRRRAKDSGAEVDEDVLATIAQIVPDNIRELGGALNRVLAFSSLMGEAVTLEMTREVLRDLMGGEPRRGKSNIQDAERVLKPGAAYLVKEERPTDCFRLFAKAYATGDGGLLITRSNPKRVRERFDLGGARILWLTDRESATEDTIPPVLERIIYEIEEFMKKGSRGAILIDGIEYLVSNNSFDAVLKFLRRLIDHISETRFTFLLSLSPATMKEQEVKILEREMEVLSF